MIISDFILQALKKKVVKNTGWIITGRIAHMICAFFVSLLTARYLGPKNYGLINYAIAFTTFFYSICTLGINSILVKALIDEPENEGETLGTSIVLQGVSSILSALMIIGIVWLIDGDEPLTVIVTAFCSIGLLFRVFETLMYWFQAHLLSVFTAITSTIGYILISIYRIILLMCNADVKWFALATSIDYFIVAILLFIFYKKKCGARFSFSKSKAEKLLRMGTPFILAGLMVSIYGNTDKFMLKQMLDEESVGYYATAVALCNVWVFVLTAIIESMYPVIMEAKKNCISKYEQYNKVLYAIVFYISMVVSFLYLIFGKIAIRILYGADYLSAYAPLSIITWYVAFSYLGVARNAWIISEGLQKYITPIYFCAAITNVLLNFIFIPIGAEKGAAAASLITQISTVFIFPLLIKPMRRNTVLLFEAIQLKFISK